MSEHEQRVPLDPDDFGQRDLSTGRVMCLPAGTYDTMPNGSTERCSADSMPSAIYGFSMSNGRAIEHGEDRVSHAATCDLPNGMLVSLPSRIRLGLLAIQPP